jgi:hypothetical protein
MHKPTTIASNYASGYIVVVQTHGRHGQYNPHLHIIPTSGGWDEQAHQWAHLQCPRVDEAYHHPRQGLDVAPIHLLGMLAQDVKRRMIKMRSVFHAYRPWKKVTQGRILNSQGNQCERSLRLSVNQAVKLTINGVIE